MSRKRSGYELAVQRFLDYLQDQRRISPRTLRAYESEMMPWPGVVNVLTRLNEMGIRLTLVSSECCSTEVVYQRLNALGLEPYFDAVLAAPDVWQQCPEQRIFDLAAEAAQLPPHRLAFVGRDAAVLAQAGESGIRLQTGCQGDG